MAKADIQTLRNGPATFSLSRYTEKILNSVQVCTKMLSFSTSHKENIGCDKIRYALV